MVEQLGERATKLALATATLLYGCGFAAEVASAGRFGFGSAPSLVRGQYFVAGFWTLLPFAACAFSIWGVKMAQRQRGLGSPIWVVTLLIALGSGTLIVWQAMSRIPEVAPSTLLLTLGSTLIFSLLVFWLVQVADLTDPHTLYSVAFMTGIVSLFVVTFVVTGFFRFIPVKLGGGRPTIVTLDWSDPHRSSENFCFVQETEGSLLVLDQGRNAISISKPMVSAIRWTNHSCPDEPSRSARP
jgi:hypothetical protein